jgi:hypothetical protein
MMLICAILILTNALIPVLSLAETEEEQRLKQEIAASAVNRVDFSKVGSEVDVISFGTVYEAESRAHDIQGRFGDMQDRKMTLGRNHFVEWTFMALLGESSDA